LRNNKLALRILSPLRGARFKFRNFAFSFICNRLNGHVSYPFFMELFLPNNSIFNKKTTLFPLKTKRNSFLIEKSFQGNLLPTYSSDIYPVKESSTLHGDIGFLFVAPRFLGVSPNLDMMIVERALKESGFVTDWQELGSCQDVNLKKSKNKVQELLDLGVQRIIVLVDILAAPEVSECYRSIDNLCNNLKNLFDLNVVALVGDIWRDKDSDGIKRAIKFVDLFVHNDLRAAAWYPPLIREVMAFFPYAGLDSNLFSPSILKDGKLHFSGQIRDADRRVWLRRTLAYAKSVDLDLKFNVWSTTSQSSYRPLSQYATELNAASACLSLSRRGLDHWILTARAHQAIRSECLILQEVNETFDPWNNILIPFEHYIPFHNQQTLRNAIVFMRTNPELSSQMAAKARQEYSNLFTVHKFVQLLANK